ncbi:MAG: phosphoribosylformylglycinamidine synthase subunit PurL [Planctomycetes bacterium]|nr:phosphoribosylformylglycinamidine synthase subunit PurL [Planctomycetota bacterium]
MLYLVEVSRRPGLEDPVARDVAENARDLGLPACADVVVFPVYLIESEAGEEAIRRVARDLLSDPVTETWTVRAAARPPAGDGATECSIFRLPGVMDPVGESTARAIRLLGIPIATVRTGTTFRFPGRPPTEEVMSLARRALANPVVDEIRLGPLSLDGLSHGTAPKFERVTVPLAGLDDAALGELSRRLTLSLTPAEMRAIQAHFAALRRDPTDVEIETLAQTWSEHCKHKTLTGRITLEDGRVIDNLLKSTIVRATRELNRPWCLSVFEDNAGVIEFDEQQAVCFKVETHNHPSALEPYGGAGTGIGGVVRDILGCGLGARPVLNTDVFCVGPPDLDPAGVPPGALHPKRTLKGVVAGVRDYGNRMGIPTGNGAVFFDERYVGNPLVYCGTVGVMPKSGIAKAARPGDLIVVSGGRTGRDGIHGATFSSAELSGDSESQHVGAVQIGNAITEKRMMDTVIQARDRGLFTAITDCGAGGLSSAVGEMGAEIGAEVDLDLVPLKYAGLTGREIWISEAQERMVLAVPPKHEKELLAVFAAEEVEATVIGRFTDTRRLFLRSHGETVGDLGMEFLHRGCPRFEARAAWRPPEAREPELPRKKDYGEDLRGILSMWNVASKEWIIRRYDHEVQGGSVVKPLVGVANDGPGDACVIRPNLRSTRGVAVGCGMNPRYGDLDPYWMAAAAIDEALRNVVSVGGRPDRTAILDNFSWGNCTKPDRLGGLVRAAEACRDTALALGTPFISGKDSLNNEYQTPQGTVTIPPSLLVSAISIVEDVRKCVTMDLKGSGHRLYLIGETRNELGGSHYYARLGHLGANVPRVDLKSARVLFENLGLAMARKLILSCHDLSEGGLAVAAAEMAFSGATGVRLDLSKVPTPRDDYSVARDDVLLFSESPTRFLVEVATETMHDFESLFLGLRDPGAGEDYDLPCACIGVTLEERRLEVVGLDGRSVVSEPLDGLKEAWQRPMRW